MKDIGSVLSRADLSMVKTEPFPHIVIENAIDENLADTLLYEYPPLDVITEGKDKKSNRRFSLGARKVEESNKISPLWKDFIARHVSEDFFHEFCTSFEKEVQEKYPDILREKPLSEFVPGVRNSDTFSDKDVLLDAQICVNTPVLKEKSVVRGPHIDIHDKLYAGLFYLRHPEDSSEGGDLLIYKWKEDPLFFDEQYTYEELVEPVATIPYKHNTLILFLNSLNSLHGVTARYPTRYPRLFMNLVGEVPQPLFSTKMYEKEERGMMSKLKSLFS
ncbi:MAG: 2OG-Fe(II) oxygenase [Candidatus Paceibacterota bacterium]